MPPTIRPLTADDLQPVVDLSLRAWAPVFASLEQALSGSGVFEQLHPDWHDTQRRAVLDVCANNAMTVWTAELDGAVVGFAAATLHDKEPLGEIYMIAVDPTYQRRGVGIALTTYATDWIKRQGMTVALIGTGGDPGHAPARRLYEHAGYTALPAVQYFRSSDPEPAASTNHRRTGLGPRPTPLWDIANHGPAARTAGGDHHGQANPLSARITQVSPRSSGGRASVIAARTMDRRVNATPDSVRCAMQSHSATTASTAVDTAVHRVDRESHSPAIMVAGLSCSVALRCENCIGTADG